MYLRTEYATCRRNGAMILAGALAFSALANLAHAGDFISVPVRWCGVEGAASMVNPGVVNELTTDDVLWRRHERPSNELFIPMIDLTLRSGATGAIKNGPQSFPIIRDVAGTGGDLFNSENADAIVMCRRAWLMGDPLYFDADNNNIVNTGLDTLLSSGTPSFGIVGLGHDGAPLSAVPGDVGYVDGNGDGMFEIGETIYRDENTNGSVDGGDTLLVNATETVVGHVLAGDVGEVLTPLPSQIKYLDLIREPANTFNIGYPAVSGVTAVNANDVEYTSIAFPVHGVAAAGIGGLGIVVDDASQYLPPGPDYTLFETVLIAHEVGHSFGLNHGDGIDDDGNGVLDDGDDPTAPVPGAGPGTLCDSNNVMSYCWLDNGTSGNPALTFIGVGAPTVGQFTNAQRQVMRDLVLAAVPDRVVDPVMPSLVAARSDELGELQPPFQHLDIAEIEARIDQSRTAAVFAIRTRRPFPAELTGPSAFFYLIDSDLDAATGGPPEALSKINVPSDFAGADRVAIVRLRGRTVAQVDYFRFDVGAGAFVQVPDAKIRALVETLRMIPDFPMGRVGDPDGTVAPPDGVAEGTQISLIVPITEIPLDEQSKFRAEFISRGPNDRVIDRARTARLDFALPVFPHCDVVPETVAPGGTATVLASGLLPARPHHLLLGDKEVATGRSDGDGRARIALPVPEDARAGPHLVTVGAIAVTADCKVNVGDGGGGPGDGDGGTGIDGAKFVYAVPFQCGYSGETLQEGVARGEHRTLITLTNASLKRARFAKRVSRGLPDQDPGALSGFETGRIAAQRSIGIECDEIRRLLPVPMTKQFRAGTVIVYSDTRLDVAATYSARPADGEVSAAQVVIIEPRPL